jgi:hypothetical protein
VLVLADDRPEAGPSKVVVVDVPVPAPVTEGVVYLAAPSDKPLVNELRQMVAGRTAFSEAKKA